MVNGVHVAQYVREMSSFCLVTEQKNMLRRLSVHFNFHFFGSQRVVKNKHFTVRLPMAYSFCSALSAAATLMHFLLVCLVIEKMSLASISTAVPIQPAPRYVHKERNETLWAFNSWGWHLVI